MVKRWGASPAATALLLLAACNPEAAPDSGPALDGAAPAADGATPQPDGSTLALELATGGQDRWTEFEDGAELLLQRGCQGSQHVFVSARVRGESTGRITITLRVRRERDGEVVSLPFRLRLPFDRNPTEDAREQTGLTLVVPVPDDVIDEAVFIEGEVFDEAERHATASRRAVIRWGPDACG